MKSNSVYVTLTALFCILLCLHIELAQCSFLPSRSGDYSSSDDDSDSLTKPLLGKSSFYHRTSPPSPHTSSSTKSVERQRKVLERADFDKESQEIQLKQHKDWIKAQRATVHERIRRNDDAKTSSTTDNRLFRNDHRTPMPPAGHQPSAPGSSSGSRVRSISKFSSDHQPMTRSDRYGGYIPPTLKDVGLQPTSSTQSNRLPGHLRHHPASTSPSHEINARKPSNGSPSTSPSAHDRKSSKY